MLSRSGQGKASVADPLPSLAPRCKATGQHSPATTPSAQLATATNANVITADLGAWTQWRISELPSRSLGFKNQQTTHTATLQIKYAARRHVDIQF